MSNSVNFLNYLTSIKKQVIFYRFFDIFIEILYFYNIQLNACMNIPFQWKSVKGYRCESNMTIYTQKGLFCRLLYGNRFIFPLTVRKQVYFSTYYTQAGLFFRLLYASRFIFPLTLRKQVFFPAYFTQTGLFFLWL